MPLEDARERVSSAARALPPSSYSLRDALGLAAAEDVVAEVPVPGFDNATMDGFAVRSADVAEYPRTLRLGAESRAGHPAARALEPGEAFPISTGAPMPAGSDAVVPVEEARPGTATMTLERPVPAGRHVRRAGEDVRPGDRLIERGTLLGPAELGVLAAQGRAELLCHPRPRVSVVTGGDELIAPGEPMRAGGVHDANATSVTALVAASGADLAGAGRTPDRPAEIRAAIETALDADVAVICGGVSVGAHDHVRPTLAELGAEESFWGVALRPGKPTWFGTLGRTLVFGLPGNPVSAMVTFLLLVRPALDALRGAPRSRLRTTAILDAGYVKEPGRTHAVRCRLSLRPDGWHVVPAPRQASHVLTSMLGADCLAIAPAESGNLSVGDRVEIELLGGPA